jgi:hypothetical protein
MESLMFFLAESAVMVYITAWFICYEVYRFNALKIWKRTNSKDNPFFWCKFFGSNIDKIKKMSSKTALLFSLLWGAFYLLMIYFDNWQMIMSLFPKFLIYICVASCLFTPFVISLVIMYAYTKIHIRKAKKMALAFAVIFNIVFVLIDILKYGYINIQF